MERGDTVTNLERYLRHYAGCYTCSEDQRKWCDTDPSMYIVCVRVNLIGWRSATLASDKIHALAHIARQRQVTFAELVDCASEIGGLSECGDCGGRIGGEIWLHTDSCDFVKMFPENEECRRATIRKLVALARQRQAKRKPVSDEAVDAALALGKAEADVLRARRGGNVGAAREALEDARERYARATTRELVEGMRW